MKRRILAMLMAASVIVSSVPGNTITALASDEMLADILEEEADPALSAESVDSEEAVPSEDGEQEGNFAAEDDGWDDLLIEEEGEDASELPQLAETEPEEEAEEELLVDVELTEAQQNLAAEETCPVFSITLGNIRDSYSLASVAAELPSFSATVLFIGGEQESIYWWRPQNGKIAENYFVEDPIFLVGNTASGKMFCAVLQDENGKNMGWPFVNTVSQTVNTGNYTLKVYPAGYEETCSVTQPITIAEASEGNWGEEIALSSGEARGYTYQAAESGVVTFGIQGEAKAALYEKVENGYQFLYQWQTGKGHRYEAWDIMEGKEYYLVLENSTGSFFGKVSAEKKKTISTIEIPETITSSILDVFFEKMQDSMISGFPVTVTYNSEETETISTWDYVQVWDGETGKNIIGGLQAQLSNGDMIQIQTTQQEAVCVFPVQESTIVPGNYEVTASILTGSSDCRATGTWILSSDKTCDGSVTEGSSGSYAVSYGEKRVLQIQPGETGDYRLIVEAEDDNMHCAMMFVKGNDGQLSWMSQFGTNYISYRSVRNLTLDQDQIYYLVLYEQDAENASQGIVSLEKKKHISDLNLGIKESYTFDEFYELSSSLAGNITYTDGSTECISSWNRTTQSIGDGNQFTQVWYTNTSEMDYVFLRLKKKTEGEAEYLDIPGDTIPIGSYVFEVLTSPTDQVGSGNSAVQYFPEISFSITLPGEPLSITEGQRYDHVSGGERQDYIFTAPSAGNYLLKFEGTAELSLWKWNAENQSVCSLERRENYGGLRVFSVAMEENATYYLELKELDMADEAFWATFSLKKKKPIQGVWLAERENWDFQAFKLQEELQKLPVVVSYGENDTETISNWGGWYCEDDSMVLNGQTDNGDDIYLNLYQAEKRVDLSGENIPLGKAMLRVSMDTPDSEVMCEKTIMIQLPSSVTPVEAENRVSQTADKKQDYYYSFTSPETGTYIICVTESYWWDETDEPGLYQNTDSILSFVGTSGRYYQYSDSEIITRVTQYALDMEAGQSYFMKVAGEADTSHTVRFERKKTIASVQVEAKERYLAFNLADQLRQNLKVQVIYEDGFKETVSQWKQFDFYEEENDRQIVSLNGQTSQGEVKIALEDKEGKQITMDSYETEGTVPFGRYFLSVSGDGKKLYSQPVTLSLPTSEEIMAVLTTDLVSNVRLCQNEMAIYSFVPEKPGYYSFTSEASCVQKMSFYSWDGSELCKLKNQITDYRPCAATDFEAGKQYYITLSLYNDNVESTYAGICFRRRLDVTERKLTRNPFRTEYIEGFLFPASENDDADGTAFRLDGAEITLTYSDDSERTYEWLGNRIRDAYGDWFDYDVYITEDGKITDPYEGELDMGLSSGTYGVVIRRRGEENKDLWIPITVVSKEAAASRHIFTGGSLTLENTDGYYEGMLYTPEKDGVASFSSDAALMDVRIFEKDINTGNTEKWLDTVCWNEQGFSAEMEAEKTYMIFVRSKKYGGSVTLCQQEFVGIQKIVLQSKTGQTQFIAGLDGILLEDLEVQVTYQDASGENVTLGADEKDGYGNSFSFVVKEKESGRRLEWDEIVDLDVGDYLVCACYDGAGGIQSENEIEIHCEALDITTLPVVQAETEFPLEHSMQRQIFAFTPTTSGYYQLECSRKEEYAEFFRQDEGRLEYQGAYLSADSTYIVVIPKSCVTQTARLVVRSQKVSMSDLPASFAISPENQPKRYLFIPEESGRYVITAKREKASGEIVSPRNGKASGMGLVLSEEKSEKEPIDSWTTAENDRVVLQCELTAGKEYLLELYNHDGRTISGQISIEKAKVVPVEILVTPKALTVNVPVEFSSSVKIEDLLQVELRYSDGTKQLLSLSADNRFPKDQYGNGFEYTESRVRNSDSVVYQIKLSDGTLKSKECMISFSDDVSKIQTLTQGEAVTAALNRWGCQYFTFTPETSGAYYVSAKGEKSKYAVWIEEQDKVTERIMDASDTESAVYLQKGILYIMEISPDFAGWGPEEIDSQITIEVVKNKRVKKLKLLTSAEPGFGWYTYDYGMTAEATYEDGTTADISAQDRVDAYGNRIDTVIRKLSDSQKRVVLGCGGRYVFCDVTERTFADLPQLHTDASIEFTVVPSGREILAGFTPEQDGEYEVEMAFEGGDLWMATQPQIYDENGNWISDALAYLEAGRDYVIHWNVFTDPEQTVWLRMKRGWCASGHTWEEEPTVDVEPTCTTKGSASIHCTVCGERKEGSTIEIPMTEHFYDAGVVTKKPTCIATGIREYKCTVCGQVETRTEPKIDHAWAEEPTVDVAPTCTSTGSSSIHCTVCNAVQEGSVKEIPMEEHSYGEGEVTLEATCIRQGVRSYTCTVCNTTKIELIDKTDHRWNAESTVDKAATCEEEGQESIHCQVCDVVKEDSVQSIPELGHSWAEEGKTDVEPTCFRPGSRSVHCIRCDAKNPETIEEIPVLAHTYHEEPQILTEPTCEIAGRCLKKCSVCMEEVTEVIPATGHSMGNWIVTREATCTETGEKTRTCEKCPYMEKELIPPTGHDYNTEQKTKPADEDAHVNGMTYRECSHGCGEIIVDNVILCQKEVENINAFHSTMEKEEATTAEKVSALTAVDNQSLIDYGMDSAVSAVSAVEEALKEEGTQAGTGEDVVEVTIGTTEVTAEGISQISASAVTVQGAAVTVAAALNKDASEEGHVAAEEGGTYAAQIKLSNEKAGNDEETGKPYYQVDISLNIVKTGTETGDKTVSAGKQLEAPIVITMPIPSIYRDKEFDLYHILSSTGEKVRIPYTRNENSITFVTPSLSDYGFENGICVGEHNLVKAEVVAATCREPGSEVWKCQNSHCTYEEHKVIPVLQHQYELTEHVDAACQNPGSETYICKLCGDEYVVQIAALQHTFGSWFAAKEATCKETGTETRICTQCDATETRDIPQIEHTWNTGYTVDKPATCTEVGSKSIHCTVCNAGKEGSAQEIPTTDHNWDEGNVTTAPTCVSTGIRTYTCNTCKTKKTESIIPLETDQGTHTWDTTYTVDKESTCEEEGRESIHCSVCKNVKENSVRTIPRTGHIWKAEYTVDKQPTCTAAGSKSHHCRVCDAIDSSSVAGIPATGHAGGTATCTKKAVCTACGQEYGSLSAHKPGDWKTTVAATCKMSGMQKQYCTVCGAEVGSQSIARLSTHTWGNWSVTKTATVLEAGMETRICTVCKAEEHRGIGKLTPTIELNVTSLPIKVKQSTNKVKVTGLAAGDSVKAWTSSNTKIATVDRNGKITGKKAGKTVVTVTLASGKTARINVTVQKGAVKTTKITGLSSKVTLNKDKKLTLKPILQPFTSVEKVTYTSSNKKVATVSSKGVVAAKKAGTAKITVKAGSRKFVVTVTVPKTATTRITNVKTSLTLKKKKTYTLKPKLNPKNSDESITYSTNNKKVATVSSKGKITAKAKGTAVITVKSGKVSVKCTVTVK